MLFFFKTKTRFYCYYYMKLFTTSQDEQVFEITPRNLSSTSYYMLKIYNEDNRSEVIYYSDTLILPPIAKTMNVATLDTVSLTITLDLTTQENQTFRLTLYEFDNILNDTVLWRDKAFATSQVSQKYKINV